MRSTRRLQSARTKKGPNFGVLADLHCWLTGFQVTKLVRYLWDLFFLWFPFCVRIKAEKKKEQATAAGFCCTCPSWPICGRKGNAEKKRCPRVSQGLIHWGWAPGQLQKASERLNQMTSCSKALGFALFRLHENQKT